MKYTCKSVTQEHLFVQFNYRRASDANQPFADIISRPMLEFDRKEDFLSSTRNYTGDRVASFTFTKSIDGVDVPSVKAFVLPSDMTWPTFKTSKQFSAAWRNLLFVKTGVQTDNRINETCSHLQNSGNAA